MFREAGGPTILLRSGAARRICEKFHKRGFAAAFRLWDARAASFGVQVNGLWRL
jgi:hypothetical protein